MDWTNERYVRVYVRDTGDLLAIGWEARALLWELMRKCDRSGLLDECDPAVIADLVRMPPDLVERALPRLIARGVVELVTIRDQKSQVVTGGHDRSQAVTRCDASDEYATHDAILIPSFLEAQESTASDAHRKRESRERRRAKSIETVTIRDQKSQAVTDGHTASQAVTDGHTASQAVTPCLAVPSRAVPNLAVPSERETRARVYGPAETADHRRTLDMRLGTLGDWSSLPEADRETLGEWAAEAFAVWGEAVAAWRATGHAFPPTAKRILLVAQRLAEGHSVEQCREVIANGRRECELVPAKRQYFAPAIFEAANFERRLAGRGLAPDAPLTDGRDRLTRAGWDALYAEAEALDAADAAAAEADGGDA